MSKIRRRFVFKQMECTMMKMYVAFRGNLWSDFSYAEQHWNVCTHRNLNYQIYVCHMFYSFGLHTKQGKSMSESWCEKFVVCPIFFSFFCCCWYIFIVNALEITFVIIVHIKESCNDWNETSPAYKIGAARSTKHKQTEKKWKRRKRK